MQQHSLLSFRVAKRRLALPLRAIRHIAPLPLLHPPVAAPPFVEGFFDFQGEPVAAIRLDRLLGLGEAKLGLYTPLLILADAALSIALHVDKVEQILKAAAIQPIDDAETLNGCVVGRVGDGAGTVYVLDPSRLLLEIERERLAAHHIMREQRLEVLRSDAVHAS